MAQTRVALISTGGTIEKTYDPFSGILANEISVLDVMLSRLQLHGVAINRLKLMNKDSLDMSEADHDLIAQTAHEQASSNDGVIIVHGTDRLAVSGDRTLALREPAVPIIFTGAMRPYELRNTDAMQNLAEALLAVQILPSGVYVVMHNQALEFPGVQKNKLAGTFVRASPDQRK